MNANSTIFKNEDWELFCNANTLSQKAGIPRGKIGLLVAKELADNALDISNVDLGYIEEDSDGGNCFYIKNDGTGISGKDEDIACQVDIILPDKLHVFGGRIFPDHKKSIPK